MQNSAESDHRWWCTTEQAASILYSVNILIKVLMSQQYLSFHYHDSLYVTEFLPLTSFFQLFKFKTTEYTEHCHLHSVQQL